MRSTHPSDAWSFPLMHSCHQVIHMLPGVIHRVGRVIHNDIHNSPKAADPLGLPWALNILNEDSVSRDPNVRYKSAIPIHLLGDWPTSATKIHRLGLKFDAQIPLERPWGPPMHGLRPALL